MQLYGNESGVGWSIGKGMVTGDRWPARRSGRIIRRDEAMSKALCDGSIPRHGAMLIDNAPAAMLLRSAHGPANPLRS